MIPYIFFILIIGLLYLKKSPVGILIALILFSALRYDVGWDYMSYYNITTNDIELEFALNRYSFIWDYLFITVYNLKMPHLGIIIPNTLTYIILYYGLKIFLNNDQTRMTQSLTVYALWPFFYLASFSTIRQQLAISIVLLMSAFIYKKKYKFALILLLINYFIHPSSIFSILLILIFLYNKIKGWHLALASILLPILIGNIFHIIDFIGNEDLIHYSEVYSNTGQNFGSKLIILNLLILVFFIYIWNNKKLEILQNKFIFIIIIAFSSQILLFVLGLPDVATRAISYLNIFLILEFFNCLNFKINGYNSKLFLLILMMLLFIVYLNITNTSFASENSTSSFVPYKFIFGHL